MRGMKIRKALFAIIEFLLIIGIAYIIITGLQSLGLADESEIKAYVVCQPDDWVNARTGPSRKSPSLGELRTGDVIYVTGEKKNKYYKCDNEQFEQGECWVHSGYIVYDEPEWIGGRTGTVISKQMLMARKNINGEVRLQLKPGAEIQVFWKTDDWCVTSVGFVMTDYLEIDGE